MFWFTYRVAWQTVIPVNIVRHAVLVKVIVTDGNGLPKVHNSVANIPWHIRSFPGQEKKFLNGAAIENP